MENMKINHKKTISTKNR